MSDIIFTPNHLMSIEEEDAKERVKNGRVSIYGPKIGLAAIAKIIGDKVEAPNGGNTLAKATLLYSIPKAVYDEYQLNKAKSYLSKNKKERLKFIYDKYQPNGKLSTELLRGYTYKRAIDGLFGEEAVRVSNLPSSKKDKDFRLKDAL